MIQEKDAQIEKLTKENLFLKNQEDLLQKLLRENDQLDNQINDLQTKDAYYEKTIAINNCSSLATCNDCAKSLGCGWCPSLNLCVVGNMDGPFIGKCPDYSYGLCKKFKCQRYKDCQSCISDNSCGWCQQPDKGIVTCMDGLADFDGCPSDNWIQISKPQKAYNQCAGVLGSGQISEDPLAGSYQNRKWEMKKNDVKNEEYAIKVKSLRESLGQIATPEEKQSVKKNLQDLLNRKNKIKAQIDSIQKLKQK